MNDVCPECGVAKGHKLTCPVAMRELKRSKRPPIANYSDQPKPWPTMRGPTPTPLKPVVDESGWSLPSNAY